MAVLDKIRVKLGVLITVLIAVALLSFIVDPSTLEMTMRSLSSKYDVGEINGKSIKYEDFQERVEYYKNIYTLQSGSQSFPEEMMDNIYQQAWQDLESKYLVVPMIKAAGVNVGEDELVDLTQGKEVSPIIAQQFVDQTGNFSRTELLNFIQSIPNDPSGNLSTYWNFLETNMERNQYITKYTSLLSKSNILSPVELRRVIEENNVTSNVEFIVSPIGFQEDTTITVSNKEIEDYYRKHKESYKQAASRDIEFVVYEVVPSQKDIDQTREMVEKVYDEFTTTTNMKVFLSRHSDTPLSLYYYKQGELTSQYPEIDEFAFNTKNPVVLPVFQKDNQFIAARVNDRKMVSDSAFVQHILVAANNSTLADSLLNVLNKGGNFSELASQFSLDQNPNVQNPGEIGWMTQSMMIPGMESVLTATPNKYYKMETNYGIHIVKVSQLTKPINKVQLALLTKEVVASKETFQSFYSKANDLVVKSEGKIANFDQVVKDGNLAVVPVNNVAEGARKLSMYDNTREVSRWIYEAKKGEVSPIITVDNQYFFIVALKEIHEEGYTNINKVAPNIKMLLSMEKKGEKIAKDISEKMAGLNTMQEIAEALNTTVSTRSDMSFGSVSSRSFDPALIGAVAGAEIGKICGPVVGSVGVYVLKVNDRATGSFYTESDAQMKIDQVTMNYQMQVLPTIFEKIGEVKDNRARFF